jgi:site-specific recombinase XerD
MTEVKEKITEYLESHRVTSLAKNTRDAYRFSLNDLEALCEKLHIHEVEHIEAGLPKIASAMQGRGITDQTIYQKFTGIKIFLKWAGYPSQFTFHISNTDRKAFKLKHARRWLTQKELEACRGYVFPKSENGLRDRLLVALLVESGCRAKELEVLRGMDIDMPGGSLFLSDSKTEPRVAFFSRETYVMMEKLKRRMGRRWEGRIFPNVSRIKEIVTVMFKDLGMKNGKDGRGPHVFRHYFASHLFFVGNMRIEEVATLMGDTVDTVRSVYLHCPANVLKSKTRRAMGWK